jgi:hypothetical protein
MEKDYMFNQRQAWDEERDLVALEGRPAAIFFVKQPNIISNLLIREPSVNSNLTSISPPKRIIRRSTQDIQRDKEINRLSIQLNNPTRSIEVSNNDKRIEYFPNEDLLIKGSGSVEDPLDIADEDTDIYSDKENPKTKKIANKMVDYTLDKNKSNKKKLKVRKSTQRHKTLILGDPNMNRERLIKTEAEYYDMSESEEEESSEEKDEDRSLIKRRDKKDDDDDSDGNSKQISSINNIKIIKNALKLDNSSSSNSEHYSNTSTPNNSDDTNNLSKKLLSLKTLVLPLILISSILALQEVLTFEEEGNKTIHYFSDTESLFKCKGGFYSAGQILALKDTQLDWIWVLMVLLAIGLTILFNLYICPTEVILRLLHGIQFQVKSLTFGLKRSDKKAKSFELLAKGSVKMLEGDSLSKIEEEEIEKINKEEELKRLEKEEDNKFPCCLEGFMRIDCKE